jgi:hypothetical protein
LSASWLEAFSKMGSGRVALDPAYGLLLLVTTRNVGRTSMVRLGKRCCPTTNLNKPEAEVQTKNLSAMIFLRALVALVFFTAATPEPVPSGVPFAADTDPVRIVSVSLSSTEFHPGDLVSGRVITTSNAAAVTAQVGTIRVGVPRVAIGKFRLSLQLPNIPLPTGPQKLIITAVRRDGTQATRSVDVRVDW